MVVENPISEDFAANVSGLSRSQKREQVKQEQRELNVALAAAGKSLIAVDGIVGPETEGARVTVAALDDGTGAVSYTHLPLPPTPDV